MTLSLRVCLLESRIQRDVNSILKRLMDHVRGFIAKEKEPFFLFTHDDMHVSLMIQRDNDRDVPVIDGTYTPKPITGGMTMSSLDLILRGRIETEQLPAIKHELVSALYHELEHAAQYGDLGYRYARHRSQPHLGPVEKPAEDDTPEYKGDKPHEGWLYYYFSPWEIEAFVTEFAKLAKMKRVPISDIFTYYADRIVKKNKLSRRQADMLVKDWERYAAFRGFGKKKSPKGGPPVLY